MIIISDNDDIYRELQKHLDTLPIGYPATESGVELRILKQLFTPDEAKVATKLSFSFDSLENIYQRVNDKELSIEHLEQLLESSVSKGASIGKKVGDKEYYANAMFMIGMYDMQSHRKNENILDFWDESSKYFKEGMDLEFMRSGICQFRVIPIEKSLTPEFEITSYDDIRGIIEKIETPIVVAECVCRHKKDLHGEPCKQTDLRETCFVLRDIFAQMYIEHGWGRIISKEEALEILDKAEEDGLVYEPGNAQRPGTLCCCCGDCCGYLSDIKQLPKPTEFLKSNYYAEVDSDECTGCGTCIERCSMNAITLVDEISEVNRDRCIGCGACVPTCPSEAIKLHKKEQENLPPQDWDELYQEILKNK